MVIETPKQQEELAAVRDVVFKSLYKDALSEKRDDAIIFNIKIKDLKREQLDILNIEQLCLLVHRYISAADPTSGYHKNYIRAAECALNMLRSYGQAQPANNNGIMYVDLEAKYNALLKSHNELLEMFDGISKWRDGKK